MKRLAILLLATSALLFAQTPPTPAPVTDPFGRESPQSAILHFLEACHTHDYAKASHFLDLRRMPLADRAKNSLEITKQLEDLLDDIPFDIAAVSRDPEGDQQEEDLSDQFEHLATFKVDGKILDLQLQRVELKPGLKVWLVSAGSVSLIPIAHQMVTQTPFETGLPRFLVSHELFETPIWRWIALLAMAAVGWFLSGFVLLPLKRISNTVEGAKQLRRGLWTCLWMTCLWFTVMYAPPATLARLYVERAIALFFCLGLASVAAAIIDMVAARWHSKLDPRVQSVSFSVLPLGRQVLKMCILLAAVLTVISWWGYNTSTILAGLGVGGLAVALAAQKTIENLFGGISVIGDRPVLVGDACRFGDRTGTIMHIGLRSTRIRTPDRTIISIPNAQFSAMPLENISGRDKYFFHPTLNLRRNTTPVQMEQVLASVKAILGSDSKIEAGAMPVRFVGVGSYSLDVEVAAYLLCKKDEEFLALQQSLLMQILVAVEGAGTALALPLQETVEINSGRG